MKKVIGCLVMVSICTSTLLAERVHIEGYMKDSSFEAGDSWLDSGKRRHFVSAKSFGEISLYSEFFHLRAQLNLISISHSLIAISMGRS